jgi:predicted RNase H-like nuclease
LRNFLETFKQPNVLDVKIGGRQEKPKKITKAVEQYKMKLNGMLKTDCDNCSDFISKYQLNQVTDF